MLIPMKIQCKHRTKALSLTLGLLPTFIKRDLIPFLGGYRHHSTSHELYLLLRK